MEMNVSGIACAGILSQLRKDSWHSIAYFFRRFNKAELNYSIYNKKLLAIIFSFK